MFAERIIDTMKRTVTYMLCLLPLLLAACHRSPKLPLPMQRAEAMMQPHPDSALAILASMTPPPTAQRFQFEAWKVLLVQARDRNYLPITPYERAIRRSVTYFDSIATDATSLRAKAHYYLGRIYQDKEDDANTVREFLTAEPLAEEAKDTTMMINAKSNIGYALWNNNFLQSADSIYRQVIPLEEKKHDWEGLAIAFNKIGDIAIQQASHNKKLIERYLLLSWQCISHTDNNEIKRVSLLTLGSFYRRNKQYDLAIHYAKMGLSISPGSLSDGFNLTLGALYTDAGKFDSAMVYLKKTMGSISHLVRSGACQKMSDIYLKQHNYAKALYYKNLSDSYDDNTIKTNNKSENISFSMKNTLISQTKEQSKVLNHKKVIVIIFAFSLILLLCFFTLLYYIIKKQTLAKEYQDHLLNEKRRDETTKAQIQEIIELRAQEKKNLQSREDFKSLPAYSRLVALRDSNRKEDSRQKLEATDWEEIETEVNSIIPHFAARLTKAYPKMTSSDIEFCIVSLFGFSFNDIPYVLGVSFQALYKRKNAILSHTGLESLAQLEEYLTHLDEADCPKTQD
jgi:hypothetical protein